MDHVYEINWLVHFWKDLTENYDLACGEVAYKIFAIGIADKPADQMLKALGNKENYQTTMVVIPSDLNQLKYRVSSIPQMPTLGYTGVGARESPSY